jgi:glutathione S-transferase
MSSYKLYYFNGRGRAEVSRLIFAAVGQKFEDIRYEQSEWPAQKNKMPLGQMPLLEYDGIKIPQSITIARFLAKQFQLAGRDNVEQAKADAVVDTISDMSAKFVPLRMEKDEAKKQEGLRKFFSEELPKHLQNLEVLGKLYGNGGPFCLGNYLTWADLCLYNVGENLLQIDGHCFNNYPWLKYNRQEVERQPKISAYLNSRPQTSF